MPTRARLRSATLPAALLAALAAAAPAAATTSSEAVSFLNQQRAANSIPASVAFDSYRTTGCRNHDHYMKLNGLGHGEDPGKPGYTSEGADYSGSGEVVAQGISGWTAGSNPWDAAPLHQAVMFDPRVSSAGYDESEGFACMRLGFDFTQPSTPAFYAFTGDSGRTGVPPSVTVQGEGPYAPQEAVGIPQGRATGPDILFWAEGFGGSDHAVSSSVTGPSGPVETRMVDSTTQGPNGSGPVFQSGGDLIPVKPLEPITNYDVAVTWENDDSGQQIPQTLSFKTGGRLVPLKLSLSRKLSRSRKATLTAPSAAVGRTATVAIAVARRHKKAHTVSTRHVVLKRRQKIKAPKPPKHGWVVVTVTLPTFTAGDARYEPAPASRRYR